MHALNIRSAAELARLTKRRVSASLIGYYLSGKAQRPSHKKLRPLAEVLETTVDDLLGTSASTVTIETPEIRSTPALEARIAAMPSPSRKLLEKFLEESMEKVRRKEDLTDDEIAQLIEFLRKIAER